MIKKEEVSQNRLNYIANDLIERWFILHELTPIDSEIYLELDKYILSRGMHSRTRKFITTDIKLKIVDEIERILMTDLENYDEVKYVVDRLRKRFNSEKYFNKKNKYNNLTYEEIDRIEEIRILYIKKFEELNENGLNYWICLESMCNSTNTTLLELKFVMKNTYDFVKNRKNEMTTKNNYLKKESLLKRINDTLNGYIN